MPKSSAPPSLDGLFDLACRDGVDIRPTLLRVLTDLYVQKPVHTAEEETQYVELALGLVDAVDAPTRAAVAASLRRYPAAPAAVLRKLNAPAAAAAATPARGQPATDDLAELFFAAPSEERRMILANLDVATTVPRPSAPGASETVSHLEAAALKRNAAEFSRTLARALGIGPALAERITRDPSGEPIVVAAKALGMKAAVLQRILLCLDPAIAQSVRRVFDLARLFDELSPQAAGRMLAIWQKPGPRSRPVHEPVYGDDERRRARGPAIPAPHRGPRDRDEQSSRFRNNGR